MRRVVVLLVAGLLLGPLTAWGAIASKGTLGTGAAGPPAASTLTHTTATTSLAAGDVGILVVVGDNLSTSDGDNDEHASVTGGTGTWTKLGEHTNANGAAAAGVTVSVWRFESTGTNGTGTDFTITFAGNVTDRTSSMWAYTVAAGKTLEHTSQAAPVANDIDASNGFGSVSFSGLTNISRLYFRGLGKEANSTTQITPTGSFTAITAQRSRNNAAAVLVRGEFRVVTATSSTSNPTLNVSGDTAGIFFAFEEVDKPTCPKLLTTIGVGC